jgi:hypothetical protein
LLRPTINIYCDESRYSNPFEQYFLIGCLSLPREKKPEVDNLLKAVRRKFGFMPELKWSNVTAAKLPYLNELLEVFFSSELEFRAIIVDKSKLKLSPRKLPTEHTFYKFYYLLLRGLMTAGRDYYVFVDQRNKSEARSLGELEGYLRGHLHKVNLDENSSVGDNNADPRYLRQLQEVSSDQVILIQLLDLLMGAVGYYWNGFRGSDAKVKLIEGILARLGKQDLKFSSRLYDKKWNQFVWQPAQSKKISGSVS